MANPKPKKTSNTLLLLIYGSQQQQQQHTDTHTAESHVRRTQKTERKKKAKDDIWDMKAKTKKMK